MIDESLVDDIRRMSQSGMKKENIYTDLIKVGWTHENVDEGYDVIARTPVPAKEAPQKTTQSSMMEKKGALTKSINAGPNSLILFAIGAAVLNAFLCIFFLLFFPGLIGVYHLSTRFVNGFIIIEPFIASILAGVWLRQFDTKQYPLIRFVVTLIFFWIAVSPLLFLLAIAPLGMV